MPKTNKLHPYLNDTYLFQYESKLLEASNDSLGGYLVLANTIFYPQGGGQASDRGTLSIEGRELEVTMVKADAEGTVKHYYQGELPFVPRAGAAVSQAIDKELRLRHARLHSAGHFLAHCVEEHWPTCEAVKGHHFPGQSYIEVLWPKDEAFVEGACVAYLNEQLAHAADAKSPVSICSLSPAQLRDQGAKIPAFLQNSLEPIRTVTYGAFKPTPCGGTHIASTEELRGIKVTKAKLKKDRLKISYEEA